MIMSNNTLEILKTNISHSNIEKRDGFYLISLDFNDLYKVTNIVNCSEERGFVLNYINGLEDISICISLKNVFNNPAITSQYWSKNSILHRDNNKPAFIFANTDKGIFMQEWYLNEKSREGNKSKKVNFEGLTVLPVLGFEGTHSLMKWDKASFTFKNSNDKNSYSIFEYDKTIVSLEGQQYVKNNEPGTINFPYFHTKSPNSAFYSKSFHINWPTKVKDKTTKNKIHPVCINFHEYREFYTKTKLTHRKADIMEPVFFEFGNDDIKWIDETILPTEFMKKHLHEFGIWNTDFFPDDEFEFIFLTEYEKTHRS